MIPTRPVDNVVITTEGLQDRNIHTLDGTTVENKGKLILNEIYRLNLNYSYISFDNNFIYKVNRNFLKPHYIIFQVLISQTLVKILAA